MIDVGLSVDELKKAERIFAVAPGRILNALRRVMIRLETKLMHSIAAKLNNNLLHRHSGTLMRSWAMKIPKITQDGTGYEGGVGSALNYARVHDIGLHKTEDVRAFTRRQASRDRHVMNLRRKKGTRQIASGIAYVRAHQRRVNYAGVRYTEAAMREVVPTIPGVVVEEVRKVFDAEQA